MSKCLLPEMWGRLVHLSRADEEGHICTNDLLGRRQPMGHAGFDRNRRETKRKEVMEPVCRKPGCRKVRSSLSNFSSRTITTWRDNSTYTSFYQIKVSFQIRIASLLSLFSVEIGTHPNVVYLQLIRCRG